jgi:hypothetical protein
MGREHTGATVSEKSKIESVIADVQSRRAFVKTSVKVAIAAPAATLLLDASTKPAQARISYVIEIDVS